MFRTCFVDSSEDRGHVPFVIRRLQRGFFLCYCVRMFTIINLLFLFITILYGVAIVWNLPYKYGISKFASFSFFAAFFFLSSIWQLSAAFIKSDWCSASWPCSLFLDADISSILFKLLVCCVGVLAFNISSSVRKKDDQKSRTSLSRRISESEPCAPPQSHVLARTDNQSGQHRTYSKVSYKNIEVRYSWNLNGGGIIFAHEFVHVVSRKTGKVGHIFEYCAGPGFIGFALLANNLCDRLTLADINPEAVDAVKETIKRNHLEDRVTVYQSDCLDDIPQNEQWDLVVSNPPWCLVSIAKDNIRVCDPESRIHEKFFRDIGKFLKPGGSVLLIESAEFTDLDCFQDMIGNDGFKTVESFRPVSFFEIFSGINEYKGLRMPLIIFLRFCLYFREAYFIWLKKT